MKTLDMIGSKLKQMKDLSFRSMDTSPPVVSQFCDWLLKRLSLRAIGCSYIGLFFHS